MIPRLVRPLAIANRVSTMFSIGQDEMAQACGRDGTVDGGMGFRLP